MKNSTLRDFDELALKFKSGDEKAARVIFDRFSPLLFRFFVVRLGERSRAEDLVQEVFLRMLSKIETYDPERGPFIGWFWRVARNILIDHYREKKPILFSDLSEEEIDIAAGETRLEESVRLKELLKTIRGFSEEEQEIFSLRYLSGFSYREISKMVGKSEPTLRVTVHRIRRRLRENPNV